MRPLVIPSIDISRGRIASIRQHSVTGFEGRFKDPIAAAIFWVQRGARRLHVIDIDGSAVGRPVNADTVGAIARVAKVTIQAGGGVRSPADAELLKRAGADLVIYRPRPFSKGNLEAFKEIEGMVLGLDLEGDVPDIGELSGWLASSLSDLGAKSLFVCDVAVEGTSNGPRFRVLDLLLSSLDGVRPGILRDFEAIYAGGTSSKADVERLSSIGFSAVVIGSALYRGLIDLGEVV